MQAPVRPSFTALSSFPFSQSRSCSKSLLARIDVVERRSSCESVTDRLELVGRMREVFRLPQYLMTAMSSSERCKTISKCRSSGLTAQIHFKQLTDWGRAGRLESRHADTDDLGLEESERCGCWPEAMGYKAARVFVCYNCGSSSLGIAELTASSDCLVQVE